MSNSVSNRLLKIIFFLFTIYIESILQIIHFYLSYSAGSRYVYYYNIFGLRMCICGHVGMWRCFLIHTKAVVAKQEEFVYINDASNKF